MTNLVQVLCFEELDRDTQAALFDTVKKRYEWESLPAGSSSIPHYDEYGDLDYVERNPEWDRLRKEFEAARETLPENCHRLANCGVIVGNRITID